MNKWQIFKLKILQKNKKLIKAIFEFDIGPVLVFMTTLIISNNLTIWQRIFGSIGLYYTYKILFNDYLKAIVLRHKK